LPKSKTAESVARSSERKRQRNRSTRSVTKTAILKTEKLIESNELESAQKALAEASSIIDKAAKKKVIHRNTASRRKSRLAKKLNKAKAAPVVSTETQKTAKRVTRKKKT
jgi:small subunit ribosomal protein S20